MRVGLLTLVLVTLGGASVATAQSLPIGGGESGGGASPRVRGVTRYASVSLTELTPPTPELVGPVAPSRATRTLFAGGQEPAQDPAPADGTEESSSGGSRFGGPLLWAMVIIGATTVGLLYLGSSLSPPSMVVPPPEEPAPAEAAVGASAGRPRASAVAVGW